MRRIFSGNRSPSSSVFTDELDTPNPAHANITESDKISPELVPMVTLLSAHLHRRYHEGVLLVLHDLKNDGTPASRKWREVHGVLLGTQLALWDANALSNEKDPSALRTSAAKPSYINFSDATIQSAHSAGAAGGTGNNRSADNVLVASTTLKNRYFLQFSNKESFSQWTAAIRLSVYEYRALQEAYTGAFISSRGARLSDIRVLLTATKYKYEDWVSVRFGTGMPWKRCYAVIAQKKDKKKGSTGEINFYESDKKIKKAKSMTTVTGAKAVYAVYPSSPQLIDSSTILKLEGTATFNENDTPQETNIFIMPEKHEAVPGYDTVIRFLIPTLDAFKLYGRPKRLIANKDDPESFLFAMPVLPHIYYLQLEDLIPTANSASSLDWNTDEWNDHIDGILQKKVARGYSGSGSSVALKNIMASPLLESRELFQSSDNIMSPLLRSGPNANATLGPPSNPESASTPKNEKMYLQPSNRSQSSSNLNKVRTPNTTSPPTGMYSSNSHSSSSLANQPYKSSPLTPLEGKNRKQYPNEMLAQSREAGTTNGFRSNVPSPNAPVSKHTPNTSPQKPNSPYTSTTANPQRSRTDEREQGDIPPFVNPSVPAQMKKERNRPSELRIKDSNFMKVDGFTNEGVRNTKDKGRGDNGALEKNFGELRVNHGVGGGGHADIETSIENPYAKKAAVNDSASDVFDPGFVEQNQMLEMQDRFESSSSLPYRAPYPTNTSKEQVQGQEVAEVRLPKLNGHKDEGIQSRNDVGPRTGHQDHPPQSRSNAFVSPVNPHSHPQQQQQQQRPVPGGYDFVTEQNPRIAANMPYNGSPQQPYSSGGRIASPTTGRIASPRVGQRNQSPVTAQAQAQGQAPPTGPTRPPQTRRDNFPVAPPMPNNGYGMPLQYNRPMPGPGPEPVPGSKPTQPGYPRYRPPNNGPVPVQAGPYGQGFPPPNTQYQPQPQPQYQRAPYQQQPPYGRPAPGMPPMVAGRPTPTPTPTAATGSGNRIPPGGPRAKGGFSQFMPEQKTTTNPYGR
ncbi:Caf120p KNAG_0F00400 [Huiozyma naganishii CBS 8797]|uniref:PH domain-containing protein n=1 Tax=Huiozyma naganishii (strain ATCC MYA-139 / BCRC 22969 / CBS 8797 / KCTC 17520 / NBRC 10181 / NCYC 3082 / Yp74L-3) TaxID=1071383 RepID=J7R770_HUIN7|nr:hypothetical protein KNAG_0F00400 [Kazachstania naganishii CBS 8797]CCK70710.1 hypothetical protein KNAG_0F00400 [Kazachstania naganishii CBS 8797]